MSRVVQPPSRKTFLKSSGRSPDTATPDEVRRFQLYLIESGASICNRNRIMTGVRFLFRVTLRRHDLAAEVWHIKEPQKLPPVLSPEEVKRVLAMATSLKARAMLTLSYGCGLRASEVARLAQGSPMPPPRPQGTDAPRPGGFAPARAATLPLAPQPQATIRPWPVDVRLLAPGISPRRRTATA